MGIRSKTLTKYLKAREWVNKGAPISGACERVGISKTAYLSARKELNDTSVKIEKKKQTKKTDPFVDEFNTILEQACLEEKKKKKKSLEEKTEEKTEEKIEEKIEEKTEENKSLENTYGSYSKKEELMEIGANFLVFIFFGICVFVGAIVSAIRFFFKKVVN